MNLLLFRVAAYFLDVFLTLFSLILHFSSDNYLSSFLIQEFLQLNFLSPFLFHPFQILRFFFTIFLSIIPLLKNLFHLQGCFWSKLHLFSTTICPSNTFSTPMTAVFVFFRSTNPFTLYSFSCFINLPCYFLGVSFSWRNFLTLMLKF